MTTRDKNEIGVHKSLQVERVQTQLPQSQ